MGSRPLLQLLGQLPGGCSAGLPTESGAVLVAWHACFRPAWSPLTWLACLKACWSGLVSHALSALEDAALPHGLRAAMNDVNSDEPVL